MNKTQLVDALAARLGDRRTAASAVDGLLETIVDTVKGGEQVALTGFGVFEARARAARTARNPRTGEAVAVPAATVPAFRPGTAFRSAVGGTGSTPAPRTAPARGRGRVNGAAVPDDGAKATATTVPAPTAKLAATKSAATKAAATKAPAKKAAGPKAAPAKSPTAKATSAKATPAKATTSAKATPAKGAAKATPAKAAPAKAAPKASAKADPKAKKPKKK